MKRTLYFGNPARLRKRNEQLLVQTEGLSKEASIPIEDIGFVLDHPEITITHSLMQALWPHGIVLLSC
ncbi:MAG: CRISPR-associated endonuclease Cas1, partial [Bacteroidota bacterium]